MSAISDVDREDLIEFVAAFIRLAEDSATIVVHCLQQWERGCGIANGQYPPLFLIELGAILRIAHWQGCEALSPLGSQFPAAAELFSSLVDRLADDSASLFGTLNAERCPLTFRVLELWHRNCSWCAPAELGTDVLVRHGDVQTVLQLLAAFAFDHGHLALASEDAEPENHY